PFAIDGLARGERRGRQLEVIRHLYGDRDDVHFGTIDEVLVTVERERHAEAGACRVGGFASAGGQRRDLEVIGERPQGGDVRLRRPATIWIDADDADANSFGHDSLLNI